MIMLSRDSMYKAKVQQILDEALLLFPSLGTGRTRIDVLTTRTHLTKVVVRGILPVQSAREEGASDTP